MPRYTFECKHCGREEEFVLGVKQLEGHKPKCRKCGEKLLRVFVAVQVVRDGLPRAVELVSLMPESGRPGDRSPVVETRTERKAALRRQNEKFGTGYEY